MSEQALDTRRSWQIVRRHKIAVGIFAALGLLAGVAYAVLRPPMLTSTALVVLAPSENREVPTQVVIASSYPVLSRALPSIRPAISEQELTNQIQVRNPHPNIISISAQAKTADQAKSTANAVADSYLNCVSNAKCAGRVVQVQARLLEPATNGTGTSLPMHLLVTGGLGALIGALIGAIGVLALNRGDRRLRARDEIANAIGVPVLASVPVARPSDAGRWTRLFEEYQPRIVHAWQLRTALNYLGQSGGVSANGNGQGDSFSVAVLSLATDRGALALGPQLAVFAASLGLPTALVIGPQQDPNAAAALRAACAEPSPSSKRSKHLRVAIADHADMGRQPGARLTIIVGVVDGRNPNVADTMRASTTLLGVSSGAATAAQLVGVAVSAATDGRQIEGILVADPDPTDHTTGRVPQLTRPAQRRMPTRLTGTTTETKR
jgi:capsular polysaccharide biosynthesis protein